MQTDPKLTDAEAFIEMFKDDPQMKEAYEAHLAIKEQRDAFIKSLFPDPESKRYEDYLTSIQRGYQIMLRKMKEEQKYHD